MPQLFLDSIEYKDASRGLDYTYSFYGDGLSKKTTTIEEVDNNTGEKLHIPWDQVGSLAAWAGKWVFRRIVENMP